MSEGIRILAAGELDTGDLRLCLAPIDSDEFLVWGYDKGLLLEGVFRLAAERGAVMFQLDRHYEEEGDAPQATLYGDEPAESLWETRIILRVDAPLLLLRAPGGDRLLPALRRDDPDRLGPPYFIALIPAEDEGDWLAGYPQPCFRALPALRPGLIRPLSPGGLGRAGWQLGDGATLRPALRLPAPQRDWDWPWRLHRTLGPVYLWLYVDRSAEELDAWLAGFAPHPYQQAETRAYAIDPGLSAEKASLWFTNGLITFVRSYHTPSSTLRAIDAVLLASLAAGDLGHVSWDLFDGDYVYYEATGHGLESLREHLDPGSDEAALRDRWRAALAGLTIDATAAESWHEVALIVAQHARVEALPDVLGALEGWLRATPITALPRQIKLLVRRELIDAYRDSPLYARVCRANTRILWSCSS